LPERHAVLHGRTSQHRALQGSSEKRLPTAARRGSSIPLSASAGYCVVPDQRTCVAAETAARSFVGAVDLRGCQQLYQPNAGATSAPRSFTNATTRSLSGSPSFARSSTFTISSNVVAPDSWLLCTMIGSGARMVESGDDTYTDGIPSSS